MEPGCVGGLARSRSKTLHEGVARLRLTAANAATAPDAEMVLPAQTHSPTTAIPPRPGYDAAAVVGGAA